jgi:hypothetical protein
MGAEEIRKKGHPGSGSTPEAARPADLPAHRDEHDWESLLVEIAWLVATPPASVTGMPRLEPSTANWTVPVGVPDPGATVATAAVKVTEVPYTEFTDDDETLAVVEAGFTVWPPARDPLLALKLPVGM